MGIFTTLRICAGEAWFWREHLARLEEGARALGVAAPPGAALEKELREAVAGMADARARITLDGDGTWRVEASPFTPPAAPWRLRPVPTAPAEAGPLLKWTSRARYDAARGAAADCDDALLEASDGTFLECTIANIFLLVGGTLLTPPADAPLLPGIARGRVLAAAAAVGISVAERPIGRRELAVGTEFFLTNALFVVHPVAFIEDTAAFRRVDVARRLQETARRRDAGQRIIP